MNSLPVVPTAEEPFAVKRAVFVGVVAALVMAGSAFGAYAMVGDVPRGTRVLGLDVGAESRTAAEHRLHDRVDAHADGPVRIRLGATDLQLRPADLGLRIDVELTVGKAMKGGVRLSGHRDVAPVVRLDPARLEAALRARLDPARITMRKPGLTSDAGASERAYPEGGFDFDPGAAAAAVRAAWPVGAVAEVPLIRVARHPQRRPGGRA